VNKSNVWAFQEGYVVLYASEGGCMSAHIMIDHVSLGTHNFAKAIAFYSACFSTLGYRLEHQTQDEAAFGVDGKWDFWVYPVAPNDTIIGQRSHVAVTADSREKVLQFFQVAIREGATAVRPVGERPDVSPDYFGTVVRDLDGHTLEVVHWAK
jgi:catechol 2,3-dioxygenase-like lactoylglutathione lyase family enzyme